MYTQGRGSTAVVGDGVLQSVEAVVDAAVILSSTKEQMDTVVRDKENRKGS